MRRSFAINSHNRLKRPSYMRFKGKGRCVTVASSESRPLELLQRSQEDRVLNQRVPMKLKNRRLLMSRHCCR